MKAIRIHGPSKVSLDEVPLREPTGHDVLVKVKAAGLCGTDYELFTNDMVYLKEGLAELPLIPGHEWAGQVEKTGDKVTRIRVGDKVSGECTVNCGECEFCQRGQASQCTNRTETGIMKRDGGFAEYILFPETHLHTFEKLSFDEASLIEPTGIALNAVIRGGVTPLDNVLVIGPGPIGLQTAQIAKKVYGANKVILSGTRDERLDRAKSYGLDGLVNINKENLKERVAEITNGRMIDVVIETSAGIDVFKEIKDNIRPFGRVVVIGFFGSKKPDIDWDAYSTRDITLIGALGSPGIWDNVIELLESGRIETRSLISHRLKLDDFEKGMDIMVKRKENACKVILHP